MRWCPSSSKGEGAEQQVAVEGRLAISRTLLHARTFSPIHAPKPAGSHERGSEREGLGRVLVGIAALLRGPRLDLGRERRLWLAPRPGPWGEPRRGQVDPGDRMGMATGEARRDPGAEVAAVRDVPLIPESLEHDPIPEIGDRARRHTSGGGGPENPKPGSEGTTTLKASVTSPP